MSTNRNDKRPVDVTRRGFIKAGTVVAAGGMVVGCGGAKEVAKMPPPVAKERVGDEPAEPDQPPRIQQTRTLGRTGFEVSDISMGFGSTEVADVIRYAYDHGVNLFDVAETYSNGNSERELGKAMAFMDRSKIFVVTKLHVKEEDTEQTLLDRFAKCQERLQTDYVDALYSHSVKDPKDVANPAFHAATAKLKADGKVKNVGISCHGTGGKGASISDVLLAAVEDGRFDMMLLVHNFLKPEEGKKVIDACREKNIGTCCMKSTAGKLSLDPFDPDNPTEEHAHWIKMNMERRGLSREDAVARILERLVQTQKEIDENRPAVDAFKAKYGINTQEEVDKASVSWVLDDPNMHTVLVAMPTFDKVDQYIPISGKGLTEHAATMLRDYELAYGTGYCRHGCNVCASKCPSAVPVSTVMRYAYYFAKQGREKLAMQKYARLLGRDGSRCVDCDAPCVAECPYRVPVQAGLIKADSILRLG